MTYGKIVAVIIALSGMVCSLTNFIRLAKCTLSHRVPATIIGYSGKGINFGVYLFTYRVFAVPGLVLQLEREVIPLMNFVPFYSIDNYVGRNVMVPFDLKKKKMLPHAPIIIVKLVLSILTAAFGIAMMIMLDKLQY